MTETNHIDCEHCKYEPISSTTSASEGLELSDQESEGVIEVNDYCKD